MCVCVAFKLKPKAYFVSYSQPLLLFVSSPDSSEGGEKRNLSLIDTIGENVPSNRRKKRSWEESVTFSKPVSPTNKKEKSFQPLAEL